MPVRADSSRRGTHTAVLAAALLFALIALAVVPALASAAPQTFSVNSTGDGAKVGPGATCETATPGECTLRAAIEAADVDAERDLILFTAPTFEGAPGDEVNLATALPSITEPAFIVGNSCVKNGISKPCAGVTAPTGANVFTVESDEVAIDELAIGGGVAGVEVTEGHTGFTATGNWFGLKLDATASGSAKAGIVLRPNADGAEIGAAVNEETNRNVFGHSEVGVLVDGASEAKILANYIGVDPEGNGQAGLGVGVRIVDAAGIPGGRAEDDEVGGILPAAAAASTECDGPCNVIVTEAGPGVDLGGAETEPVEPASGPTRIRGNYLGLAADGITPVGEAADGVYAGPTGPQCESGPGDVTVGGAAPTETNYVDGGATGLFAEGAENFRALGNSIGLAANGRAGAPPVAGGIEVCAEGVIEPAQISNNDMVLGTNAVGIYSSYGKAQITGNAILGGHVGVFTDGESEGRGDLISGNTLTDPGERGIYILSQSNVMIGNTVTNAGTYGIELEGNADHNRIGGDSPGEENNIDGSGEGAISISGEESTRNEVASNNGLANAGAFIQLAGTGGEIPNGGIKPPAFATILQSSATGTAQPGATVRVFRKASAEVGELRSLLAVVKADPLGTWKATYGTVPSGTLVAATQTSGAGTPAGGTSEVSAPVAAAADPVEPGGGGSGGGSNGGRSSTDTTQPPAPPTPGAPSKPKAPKVTITKRPKVSSKSTTAKFAFKVTPAAGAKFQCRLDDAKWSSCRSPKTYKNLKPRKHTFRVRTIASGLTSPAAKFKFTVGR